MEFDLENPLQFSNTIPSLFLVESEHMPSRAYRRTTDSDVSVRRETISLIFNFSRDFDPFLYYLAVNYLDRFLSTQQISEWKPWALRLLAVSCVSLALKMNKTEYRFTDIQQDGGFIFDKQSIQRMELIILGALKWRMRSITPFCFIEFFISLFKFKDPPLTQALKARATEILFEAQNETKVLEFKASIVAASALLCASHELFPLQFPSFRKLVSNCSYVNKNNLISCNNLMEKIAKDGYESVMDSVSSSSTPANVLDWHGSSCSSSSSSSGSGSGSDSSKTKLEAGDTKRRKITSFRTHNTVQLSQIQQC